MSQPWRRRFEAFVAKKTQLAANASLPPYLTQLDAPDERALAIGNAWSARLFDGPFYQSQPLNPERPACSLVFVQSVEGNTGAANPASLGGGDTDKHLIYEGLSRVASDGVLAGAETIRGTDVFFSVWHPELIMLRASLGLPRHPVQMVATLRGLDLNHPLLFNVPEVRVVMLTVARAAEEMRAAVASRPWVSLIVMDQPEHLPDAFERLRDLGIARVSCIGGRTLAGQLLEARLVDDVYLTTAARRGGEPGTPLYAGPWRGPVIVRKQGTGPETGIVFEHLRPAMR
jgi:riboflavin biosynthesis pyrimidine reductase